jgi:hypothetical protein
VAVAVCEGVCVIVAVGGIGVCVGVTDGVLVIVGERVAVNVFVGVLDGVEVEVGVRVSVGVEVAVGGGDHSWTSTMMLGSP